MHDKMRLNGYVHLPRLLRNTSALSSIIDELERVGLPAQFMLLFDEVWEAVNSVSSSLEPVFGLVNIQDFFVFNVPPGGAGWSVMALLSLSLSLFVCDIG